MDFGIKTSWLLVFAQRLAENTQGFFNVKGPGAGDRATNEFMERLNTSAKEIFGKQYSCAKICGETEFSVEFYNPGLGLMVELAHLLFGSPSEVNAPGQDAAPALPS